MNSQQTLYVWSYVPRAVAAPSSPLPQHSVQVGLDTASSSRSARLAVVSGPWGYPLQPPGMRPHIRGHICALQAPGRVPLQG